MVNYIKAVSDTSFEEHVRKAGTPVLLLFWAEWSGPCKMITTTLEDIAQEYGERLQLTSLNVDENSVIPAEYGVREVPTLILYKNGNVVERKVGALSRPQLASFLDKHL
ncbi:hypothetical protein BGZ72_002467 [Mortierella alpina]|nr:hypothetical protein BGZ72_002467 [Mortierella alpina]